MRQVLYTEKTIAQCNSALNERLQNSRANMDGWVEKNGTFSISLTTPVIGRFERRTTLHGTLQKGDGHTIIEVNVPTGADRRGMIIMFAAIALIVLALMGSGNVPLALLVIPIAAWMYIPMRGDNINSETLLGEVQRTLKGRATPPKRTTGEKSAAAQPKPPAKPASSKAAGTPNRPKG
jgi:hypothetical protein